MVGMADKCDGPKSCHALPHRHPSDPRASLARNFVEGRPREAVVLSCLSLSFARSS